MVGAVLTTMAITATSDIPIAILTLITANFQITSMSVAEKISTAVFTRPADSVAGPLVFLSMGLFALELRPVLPLAKEQPMLTTHTSVGSNSELRTSTKRIAGLLCVALGSIILVWCGFSLQAHSSKRMLDFRVIYYNLRVLLDHKDPYNALNGEQLAMEDGEKPRVYPVPLPSEITCIYPPSALVVNAPLGFLHRVPAQRLWTALNGGGLIISGFLLWEIAAEAAPLLSGLLIGFLLANSAGLLFQGNVAGIVVSLCVIATWCFFRERYVALAIVCMAVSLAIKPHDSGFVWLCLLFIQRYRKPALQVLLVTAMLILISALWVTHVAPGWPGELKANLISVSARGTGNDPGPASGSNTVANADVNLQAIFSVIKDEPAFYNPASFLSVQDSCFFGSSQRYDSG